MSFVVRLERAAVQQTMARTRSSTGALPKDKETKTNVEEMKEKLEAQLKLQRAAHQQRTKGATSGTASPATPSSTSDTPLSKATPQHVIKILPNTSGKFIY